MNECELNSLAYPRQWTLTMNMINMNMNVMNVKCGMWYVICVALLMTAYRTEMTSLTPEEEVGLSGFIAIFKHDLLDYFDQLILPALIPPAVLARNVLGLGRHNFAALFTHSISRDSSSSRSSSNSTSSEIKNNFNPISTQSESSVDEPKNKSEGPEVESRLKLEQCNEEAEPPARGANNDLLTGSGTHSAAAAATRATATDSSLAQPSTAVSRDPERGQAQCGGPPHPGRLDRALILSPLVCNQRDWMNILLNIEWVSNR